MYNWRMMTEVEREKALTTRRLLANPRHSVPHRAGLSRQYLLTAACYEHKPHIGWSPSRIAEFEEALIGSLQNSKLHAYVVLPNHYHALVSLCVRKGSDPAVIEASLRATLKSLFALHQKTGFAWNKEERSQGRRVWCNVAETVMKSDRHFHATVNYVHNNPVKHGYCTKWTDWPYSSATAYLDRVGRKTAIDRWREFDISEMGDWDID